MRYKVGDNVVVRYDQGSWYIGRIGALDPVTIGLDDPVWIGQTGRQHLFWQGPEKWESSIEIEAIRHPTDLPRAHAHVTAWPWPIPDTQ